LISAAVYIASVNADESWQTWPVVGVYEGVGKAFVAGRVLSPQRGAAYGTYHAAIGLAALPAGGGRDRLAGIGPRGGVRAGCGFRGRRGDSSVEDAAVTSFPRARSFPEAQSFREA